MRGAEQTKKDADHATLEKVVDHLNEPAAVLTFAGAISHENEKFHTIRSRVFNVTRRSAFITSFGATDRARIKDFLNFAKSPDAHGQSENAASRCIASHGYDFDFSLLHHENKVVGVLVKAERNVASGNLSIRDLMEHLDQGVWDYNLATNTFVTSSAWGRLRGLPDQQIVDLSEDRWLKNVHTDDRQTLHEAFLGQAGRSEKNIVVQYRYYHAEGRWIWIMCRASVVEADATGRPLRIIGTDTDVTEAMENQASVTRLASKLKLAVEASGMGIWEFNPDTKQVHWDDRMLEIYGILDGQNIRSDNLWETHLHPDDFEETVAYAEECQSRNADFKRDYRIIRLDGAVRHVRSVARTVPAANGSKLIGVNIDVTEDYQRTHELEVARAKLEHDAMHDALTGLGNRRALDQHAMALFNRIDADAQYAAMHIDLDHFKDVNDTLGHSAGDHVLARVGRVLTRVIGTLGRVYRLGGDEFGVLFEKNPGTAVLAQLSQQIIGEVSAPNEFEGNPCTVGASVGYAIGNGPPKSPSSIFIEADTALYAAKRAGRGCYRAYTQQIGSEFHLISNTRQDLKEAISADQIVCVFQPQYDAGTLEVIGAEALVRWQCPKRGLLAPFDFLPNALDAGLLGAVDYCVFQRVLALQADWRAKGLQCPRVSLNISRARFDDADMIEQTREMLTTQDRVTFELLETTYYDVPSTETLFKLDTLREMGIRIEMDDFGTGYSSVKALQALRPDAVKIDRSLVAPLGAHFKQLEILQNLSRIARLEGADVVVEGLETGAHLAAIRMLDCDVLQGYVLQRPMTEIEFAAFLSEQGTMNSYKTGT